MKKGFLLHALLASSIFVCISSYSQNRSAKSNQSQGELLSYPINIHEELDIFNNGIDHAIYRLSICADIPNNEKPSKVSQHHETGHVFLILQKINGSDTINKVFGFYPKRELPTLLFKKVKSKIRDNSRRGYDVDITRDLTAAEFDTVVAKSIFYSRHVYHINKFNCYDYALVIFNSIAGNYPLPVTHIKFPFIFGSGGSPCAMYKDLQQLKQTNSCWAGSIRFGNFVAPASTGRISQIEQ